MDEQHERLTYPPLNTLKPVATDFWVVDGPMIRFGMPWPKMPFSTRMTIIRLKDKRLFIHSPTLLTDGLRAEMAEIGNVSHIIGPNRIHYWWIPEWHHSFPKAKIWLAPRINEQMGDLIAVAATELNKPYGHPGEDKHKNLQNTGKKAE